MAMAMIITRTMSETMMLTLKMMTTNNNNNGDANNGNNKEDHSVKRIYCVYDNSLFCSVERF